MINATDPASFRKRRNPSSASALLTKQKRLDRISDATAVLRYVVDQGWMPISFAAEVAKLSPFEQKLAISLHTERNESTRKEHWSDSEFRRLLFMNLSRGQNIMVFEDWDELFEGGAE